MEQANQMLERLSADALLACCTLVKKRKRTLVSNQTFNRGMYGPVPIYLQYGEYMYGRVSFGKPQSRCLRVVGELPFGKFGH